MARVNVLVRLLNQLAQVEAFIQHARNVRMPNTSIRPYATVRRHIQNLISVEMIRVLHEDLHISHQNIASMTQNQREGIVGTLLLPMHERRRIFAPPTNNLRRTRMTPVSRVHRTHRTRRHA